MGFPSSTHLFSAEHSGADSPDDPNLFTLQEMQGRVSVMSYGVKGDGVADDTAAIQSAVLAAPVGSQILMPPGTYKITGNIDLAKVGQRLVMEGATINSTAGEIRLLASQTMIDARGGSVLNFTNGNPASSLDRAVRVIGNYNGSLLPITGTIAAKDVSFVATNAADVAGTVAGDWLIVGEFQTDWQRQEWKQVLSVVGTTVTVTTPFRRAMSTYTMGFYKVTPVEDCIVRGLYIKTTGLVNDNYGIDAEICRNLLIDGCRFDIAKGMAWQVYLHDSPTIKRNLIDRQGGRRSSIGACVDGYVGYNRWLGKGGMPTAGCISVETGTAWSVFEANSCVGVDLSGLMSVIWCDFNRFIANTFNNDGSSIALFVTGGDGNISIGNEFHNVLEGLRFADDPARTPSRTCIGNTSIGDKVRNATRGVQVRSGAVNSSVFMLDCDSTVTTPIVDSGTNTSIFTKDVTTGVMLSGGQIAKLITAIPDATATNVFTASIPNSAQSAVIRVRLVGALGAGGAIGADEASASASYDVVVTRVAGVNAVATVAAVTGNASAVVAGAATITVTGALTAVSGAVGAVNTVLFRVTITRGSGTAANHICMASVEVLNANSPGVTVI